MDNQLRAAATQETPKKKIKAKSEVFQGFIFLIPHHKSPSGYFHLLPTQQFHFWGGSKMSRWWWAIYPNYFLSQFSKRKSPILLLLLSELPS